MKHFNVTLMEIEGYPHSRALEDAAKYIHWCLVNAGYSSVLATNQIDMSAYNVIFCAHLMNVRDADNLPKDTIIFNSEQLQNKDAWYMGDGAYRAYLDRFYVWDYSIKNLSLVGHPRVDFIPFLYCHDMRRRDMTRTPGKDLCFYGVLSERRKIIFDAMKRLGVPVEVMFGKYGEDRDREILQSWAVLNLRQFDDVKLFEPIRCFYPLSHGVPIISEAASQDPTFDYYKDWIFAFETAELAEKTAALYADPDTFARAAREKVGQFKATSGPRAIKEAVETFLEKMS